MVTLRLFMVVVALVFFLLAGLGIPSPPRLQWLGWGLFLWVLSSVIENMR